VMLSCDCWIHLLAVLAKCVGVRKDSAYRMHA
jgi:hypothetical protein